MLPHVCSRDEVASHRGPKGQVDPVTGRGLNGKHMKAVLILHPDEALQAIPDFLRLQAFESG